MKKKKTHKGTNPQKVHNLPDGVKEAWHYGGKNPSFHFITADHRVEIYLNNGVSLQIVVPGKQFNFHDL